MELFVHPSPVGCVKVAVGTPLVCGSLVGGLDSWSSGDPNPLFLVVAPVTVVPLKNDYI